MKLQITIARQAKPSQAKPTFFVSGKNRLVCSVVGFHRPLLNATTTAVGARRRCSKQEDQQTIRVNYDCRKPQTSCSNSKGNISLSFSRALFGHLLQSVCKRSIRCR